MKQIGEMKLWKEMFYVPFTVFDMSLVDCKMEELNELLSLSLILVRKYSMNEKGVIDCILHFNVLSTRSSIL